MEAAVYVACGSDDAGSLDDGINYDAVECLAFLWLILRSINYARGFRCCKLSFEQAYQSVPTGTRQSTYCGHENDQGFCSKAVEFAFATLPHLGRLIPTSIPSISTTLITKDYRLRKAPGSAELTKSSLNLNETANKHQTETFLLSRQTNFTPHRIEYRMAGGYISRLKE